MTIGGMTGGLLMAHCIAERTPTFDFAGYEIYPAVAIIAGIAGGIAPDVDMPHSKAGRFLRRVLRGILIASALFMILMAVIPQTGIGVLDRAVSMGAGIDRTVPLFLAAFCILIMSVIEKSKHRGFTHTPVGLFVISVPLLFMLVTKPMFTGADIAVSAQIGFALGWLSHMIADTFNSRGIPWLWPIMRKNFNIMRITGKTNEEIIFRAMSVLLFAACYGFIIF